MMHNGYDYARKKGFGKVKIGKQICLICWEEHREDKGFWKGLLSRWKDAVTDLIMALRDSHVAWEKISGVMNYILSAKIRPDIYSIIALSNSHILRIIL